MGTELVNIDVVKRAVRLASRAPSLYNSQPWRWNADRKGLHLFLDTDRIVHATDRSGREAVISCGVVLDHLRVAMAAAGWESHVERFPNPNNPEHLASISFSPMEFVTDAHRRRADAILLRRTDRLPMAAPPDWESVQPMLAAAVSEDAAGEVNLDVIADSDRPKLAEASMLTESLRLYDSSYHAEIDWWTSDFAGTEGMPRSSMASAAESDRVDVGRNFPVSHHQERRGELPEDHSKVVVLSTYDNTRRDALACGEALSGVLLEATLAGLGSCTLTHITELAGSREVVAAILGRDTIPQALVRIGLAPELGETPAPTPRRPLDEVLSVRSE